MSFESKDLQVNSHEFSKQTCVGSIYNKKKNHCTGVILLPCLGKSLSNSMRNHYNRRFLCWSRWPGLSPVMSPWYDAFHDTWWHHFHGWWTYRRFHLLTLLGINFHVQIGLIDLKLIRIWTCWLFSPGLPASQSGLLKCSCHCMQTSIWWKLGMEWKPTSKYSQRSMIVPLSEVLSLPDTRNIF